MYNKYYFVWVGGVQVHDHRIFDHARAQRLADLWESGGYDDVVIETVEVKYL
jgi:hypothetical protein